MGKELRVLLLGAMVTATGCDAAFQLDRATDASQHVDFIQVASAVPADTPDTVQVAYPGSQGAGDLNVVAIGWEGATTITSVTDIHGGYEPAVGATTQGTLHHAMYYRANIAPAAPDENAVTVTFSGATNYPDVRIAEYAGIDPKDPLELGRGSGAIGTAITSGAITTRHAHDLLVAAVAVGGQTEAVDDTFTWRVKTAPNSGTLQDRELTVAGTIEATATQNLPLGWVIQVAAFRGQ